MMLIQDAYTNKDETLRVRIETDHDPLDPREDDEGIMGSIIATGRRSHLGDHDALVNLREAINTAFPDASENMDLETPQELYQALDKLDPDEEVIFHLPVYCYEHSGIALNTTGFSCPWDSGQIGFVWATRQRVESLTGQTGTTEELRTLAHNDMRNEIETLSQYVSDEVYRFICETYIGPEGDDKDIDDEDNWEEEDSCSGFFGMDLEKNDLYSHLPEKYQQVIVESEGRAPQQAA